jgi:hypothetical protein
VLGGALSVAVAFGATVVVGGLISIGFVKVGWGREVLFVQAVKRKYRTTISFRLISNFANL